MVVVVRALFVGMPLPVLGPAPRVVHYLCVRKAPVIIAPRAFGDMGLFLAQEILQITRKLQLRSPSY